MVRVTTALFWFFFFAKNTPLVAPMTPAVEQRERKMEEQDSLNGRRQTQLRRQNERTGKIAEERGRTGGRILLTDWTSAGLNAHKRRQASRIARMSTVEQK